MKPGIGAALKTVRMRRFSVVAIRHEIFCRTVDGNCLENGQTICRELGLIFEPKSNRYA